MSPPPLVASDFLRAPNPIARHYSRFRVAERLLLTGHSHQAWPDAGFDGQLEAWNDAAELVDGKWERAAERADRVRRGFARLLDAEPGEVALGANTHELVVRWLSALPLDQRPRLVTTDGEFHTIRRQLAALAATGRIEVVRVAARPASDLAARLADRLDPRTAAVLCSSVLYADAHVVPGLGTLLDACLRAGAELLVDAYHHLNAVPFSLRRDGLEGAFVTGGGYKYCQLGEGNAFLRVPPRFERVPVITGWFSEFEELETTGPAAVSYGAGPARWAGATYDPTSHYRAARVFDFFAAHGLTPELLREVSRDQVALLASELDALDLDPAVVTRDRAVPLDRIGGFLALRAPRARELSRRLAERGVATDARGDVLRLGPAPYLRDDQIRRAVRELGEVARAPAGEPRA